MTGTDLWLLALCGAGVVGGLTALWRGFAGYRRGVLISGTGTSRIATLAAGEVRITGRVEPAELLLRSPLQDRECVWYRSSVVATSENRGTVFRDERGIGFRVADASGSIRVFPRGARIDCPNRFDASTGLSGGLPLGARLRDQATAPVESTPDREALVAELLTVHQPRELDASGWMQGILDGSGPRRFEEARLEPGDVVTILGTARPFREIDDPSGANAIDGALDPYLALDDPTIAADLEAARAAGTLLTPEEAWGNAAIPGFGIGRPVRAPELDPGVRPLPLATPVEATAAAMRFDIGPDQLVLAVAPDAPMLLAFGVPGDAEAREQGRFLLGLAGAILAIASGVCAALLLWT